MTREAFIKILDEKGYSYKIIWNKILVTHSWHVDLRSLETINPGVVFNNRGDVDLRSLKTLPPGVEFKNRGGCVDLRSLKTLSHDVGFDNSGYVDLSSLKTISPGVKFNNEGEVDLRSLKTIPPGVVFGEDVESVGLNSLGWFSKWNGNIEGIDSKMLLNLMISKGMFI